MLKLQGGDHGKQHHRQRECCGEQSALQDVGGLALASIL